MATVPLRGQLLAQARADATLCALLADGADSIYPRAAVEIGPETDGPFIVLRMEADSAFGIVACTQSWTWYVYDEAYNEYWDIDRIIVRLCKLTDRQSYTYDGHTYGRAEWAQTSGEANDEGWHKAMRFVRFSINHL